MTVNYVVISFITQAPDDTNYGEMTIGFENYGLFVSHSMSCNQTIKDIIFDNRDFEVI